MKTVVYQVEQLISALAQNYPAWPSTFSTCECQNKLGRGGGKCADCIEADLASFIGKPLAWEIHRVIHEFAAFRDEAIKLAIKMEKTNEF